MLSFLASSRWASDVCVCCSVRLCACPRAHILPASPFAALSAVCVCVCVCVCAECATGAALAALSCLGFLGFSPFPLSPHTAVNRNWEKRLCNITWNIYQVTCIEKVWDRQRICEDAHWWVSPCMQCEGRGRELGRMLHKAPILRGQGEKSANTKRGYIHHGG
jgi:hypothetical protein